MITANAGNDAGRIATYASVGADHGYRLLWILFPLPSVSALSRRCAPAWEQSLAKGLADLIRERFGVRWTAFIMFALLIANGGVTVSEIRRYCCGDGVVWVCRATSRCRSRRALSGGW